MSELAMPPIVDRATWDEAMKTIEADEEALAQKMLESAALRRKQPMTPVEGDYTFTGADGEVAFADVFGDARQLVVYHFMYAPEWEKGCPHCTQYARDQGPGINTELNERDARYVLMSRAPYEKLSAWADEQQITTPWYSVSREFMEEMGQINDDFGDFPGISVFFRDDDGNVYRTFHTTGRAVELTMPTTGMMRMLPWGLQEKGEDSPAGWPQRFDAM